MKVDLRKISVAQVNVTLGKLLDTTLSGAITEPSLFAWSATFIGGATQVVGIWIGAPIWKL